MKMKRRIAALIMIMTMAFSLTACGSSSDKSDAAKAGSSDNTVTTEESASEADASTVADGDSTEASDDAASSDAQVLTQGEVRVGTLKGPTTIGLAQMIHDESDSADHSYTYSFTMASQPTEIVSMLASGKLDMALIPANLAAVLYNKTKGGVQVTDINTLGVLYCVTGDTDIKSIQDLAGKTVVTTGQGASPEYVINYLLNQYNVKDVKLEFKSEATEIAALLNKEPDTIAILPQPFVTAAEAKNQSLATAFSLNDAWEQSGTDSKLIQGVTVARTEFIKEHPDVVKAFTDAHKASADKAVSDVNGTADIVSSELGIIASPQIAAKAIPECNVTCITGEEMKTALSGYLKVLMDADKTSVGGTLPGDDFYYTGE